jgi:uncharacterized DUF497 family protein
MALRGIYDVNREFEWDAGNLGHIAKHGVQAQEAEEAILVEPLEADVQSHDTEDRVLCYGRTKAGRLLTVLYVERDGKIRVVTAYPMTRPQQLLYFKGQ